MDVSYQPLSAWQKRDCINRSAEYDCPNPATQEATLVSRKAQVYVRCCPNEPCMDRAAELARIQFDAFDTGDDL